tara:strand:+ start:202 stop:762 length:561 start_codon:yes stop_codon:yes gene_type:complete
MQIHDLYDNRNTRYVLAKLPASFMSEISKWIPGESMEKELVGVEGYNVCNELSESFKNYLYTLANCLTSEDLEIDSAWMNFMYKHEFQPPHYHAKKLSFVIWYETPYDISDEINTAKVAMHSKDGQFYFVYAEPSKDGEVKIKYLPADSSWNGTIAMFPANLMHGVHPFKTSNKPRISIAGNLKII